MQSIITDLIILLNKHIRSGSSFVRKNLPTLLAAIMMLLIAPAAYSLNPDFYAATSRLSSGKWAKIEVTATGMQLITNATLKSLGFSDPQKVNVYGFGGRVLSESLDNSMTDDLPILPSVITPEGIIFFGHDHISWNKSTDSPGHKMNPYSEKSFYFISDCDATRPEPGEPKVAFNESYPETTKFKRRILHEQEVIAPYDSGSLLLGEDFKTQPRRVFSFNLPDAEGEADVNVCFGANVSNGSSTLNIDLGDGDPYSCNIPGVNSSQVFLVRKSFSGKVEAKDKLDVTIQYSNTGVASTAALDFIEIFYDSSIRLRDNQLYFYIEPTSESNVRVENCNETTVIWDVTDPLHPRLADLRREGSSGVFTTPAGYHEYVAFNNSKCGYAVKEAGKIANQNIHGMDIPEMLIVAPYSFKSAADRLALLHEQTDGRRCLVLTPEEVYNEFSSGTPDATAFRKLLKMWYDRAQAAGVPHTKFCLLMSRPTYDNKGCTAEGKKNPYPRIPIWQTETYFSESTSYSTDDYIGMLADNIIPLNKNSAEIMVAVGRMPVRTLAEAESAVAKIEKYLKSPNLGYWRNNIMVIADDQDAGVHLKQAETVMSLLTSAPRGDKYVYEKLYLDAYPLEYSGVGAVYPQAKARLLEKWNEGVAWIDYIGHANPTSWTHENLLTWNDINSMNNKNLPFLYAATCEFLRWDSDDISGGEIMWQNPDGGVIGMICPSRTVYITLNGLLNAASAKFLLTEDENGNLPALGEVMVKGKNDTPNDNNKLRYGFCGDPSLTLPNPSYEVRIDGFNGTLPGKAEDDYPVVGARGTISLQGSITDRSGNVMEDFDGIVELRIFDSETVRTTLGNGADGKVDTYNDRKNRLYTGRAKVNGGRWSTTAALPSEIENNYSPALISLYGYSDTGKEATGSFDKFYIYGFSETAQEDNEGPVVSELWLNNPGFLSGDVVSPSSLFKAVFSDPSGINVSDGGIGHNLSLTIDEKNFISDLALYYAQNEEDATSGSVTYPLSGLEPGEHTLKFTVWDNANNSTTRTLDFKIAADWTPTITTLTTDAFPATSSVNFIVATDGVIDGMECAVDVIDLSGKTLWTGKSKISENSSSVRIPWDLNSSNGGRLPRGIYMYRATVTGKNGYSTTKTKKIAVAAS